MFGGTSIGELEATSLEANDFTADFVIFFLNGNIVGMEGD